MGQLSDVLTAARAHASLSLAGLAEKVGSISRQALSHYETGEKVPPAPRISQIAVACGVDIVAGADGSWTWTPKKKPRKPIEYRPF